MMRKTGTKKKEGMKNSISQFLRSTDDEIKADASLFSVRKTRNVNSSRDYFRHKKQVASGIEKSSIKTEKFEPESQIQLYVPNASVDELETVIRQAASTSEDKYKILDARDRLMRIKQTKSQLLSLTKVMKGTCPDMCPEKERLMRESQRQVASYELLKGAEYRINHETAVKQYSRSSADQEEPMPQDLRPVKSLKMTMSYLLHEIADLCEQSGTNLAEWYHFLWDRTRGIRKDITQQDLCCHESVELIEQCSRFHIVCAERLCAEEVSVFDKQINTENLTKCLQTLKYMYHDLRVKGIVCKNEPEFRAYIILLNLNNGNFMWDVQRLPSSVQKSPEIRFAIQVYSSIASNNYAKFFRLARSTTYLNACILLRYFNQVRVKALSIMVKAYCRTASTAYPLYELIDILGFEDENDAVYFSEQVGLKISNDDLQIMLKRQNFSLPVSNIKQGRACNIVESKRIIARQSIGQCIAGKTMPEKLYKGHRPHDSFDGQGYLKAESLTAEDQNTEANEKRGDQCDYMDDDRSDADKIESTAESFEIPVSHRRKQANNANIFKMPIAVKESNAYHGSLTLDKQITPSAAGTDVSSSDPFVAKSRKRPSDASNFFARDNAEVKKKKKYDRRAATKKDAPSIFGNATLVGIRSRANVSSKPVANPSKTCVNHSPEEETTESSTTTSTSIFGMVIKENAFGNVSNAASIFASPFQSSKISSKSTTDVWTSGGKPSVFQSSQQSRDATARSVSQLPDASKNRQHEELGRTFLEQERQEIVRRVDIDAEAILDEFQNKIIHDLCSTTVKEEIDRMELCNVLSETIVDEIIDDLIGDDCEDILNREMYVERKLEQLSRQTKHRIILKYYKIWRQYSLRKRQQRNALDVTPVSLQNRSVEDCAKSLYRKGQHLAIMNMRQKRLKSSNEDSAREFLEPIESKIYAGMRENAKALDIGLATNLFWKMVISWPHLENRPLLWRLKKIMNQYICPSDDTVETIIKSYKPNSYETLHICIKHFEGLISDRHLAGTDGLFFIATCSENPNHVVRRLTSTILSRQKLMPIPVIIVILGEGNDRASEKIKLDNELTGFLKSGYISEYIVHYEETVDEEIILKLIQNATLWLTINKSPPMPLEMDYLGSIVDACLTEELWHRILGHSSFNSNLEAALQDVQFVIDLHNEAVTHLIDIVLDPESLMYTDIPPEFNIFRTTDADLPCSYEYFDTAWKREECREKLERTMNNLLLPKWTYEWPIDDTLELHKCLARYCQKALTDSNCQTVSCNILSNLLLMPRAACKTTSFIQVLLEVVKEKIRHLKPDPRVVYNKNHVKHFRNLPWWFKSSTLTNYNQDACRSRDPSVAPESSMIIEESFDIEDDNDMNNFIKNYDSVHEAIPPSTWYRRQAREQAIELGKMSEKLEKSLAEQKSHSRLLQEKMEAALSDSDVINVT